MTGQRRAAPALSHDAICEAAIALIDAGGLEAFSTRKLGRELGCEAMAIYWYYASKDELLDAVVDKLMAGVAKRVTDHLHDDWIAVLRELAHAYRGVARDHPNAFPLLATRRFASDDTYAFMERLFELARRLGIDDKNIACFYRVVSSYCNGFALNEIATLRSRPKASLRKKYTRVAAVSAWLEPRHLDEMFEFGLELQLDALARIT